MSGWRRKIPISSISCRGRKRGSAILRPRERAWRGNGYYAAPIPAARRTLSPAELAAAIRAIKNE